MKKYKLHTNPNGYNMAAYYQDIVNAWNDNAHILDGLGYKATMADLTDSYRQSSQLQNDFINRVSANAIAEVWERFDYEPNERTISAIMMNEPIRHAIDKKAQKVRQFLRNMYERVGGHPSVGFGSFSGFWEDCGAFEMVDNRIICRENAQELILDYFTTYTETNRQAKVYEELKTIQEKLNKLGINFNPFKIDPSGTFQINWQGIRTL